MSRTNRARTLVLLVAATLLTTAVTVKAETVHVYAGEAIQAAINGCTHDDEIIVHPGTYSEAIDFSGKAIWLHSSDGPEATTIDATGSGQVSVVTCVSGEGPDTILEGFTITGGSGTDPGDGYRRGGGMRNQGSSPTVTNCTFTANSAYFGGGMYNLDNGSPTVTNCTFSENTANYWGGGMCNWDNSSPTVTNCTFSENQATHSGGGMYNWGDYVAGSASPTVTNCTFSGNTATDYGGGMFNYIASPTLTDCAFSGNAATQGGAVFSRSDSYPMLAGCTFTNNTASDLGGALYNEAYGIPTVTNCILWGDAGGEIYDDGSSTPIVTYSDVQGGTGAPWFGAGCIDADPLFVDPGAGSFRLCDYSPCTDAGNNNAVPPEVATDLDGSPRLADDGGVEDTGLGDPPIVDMGAYERQLDSGEPIQVPGDYATIQAAIDAACVAGNEIVVAAGTYSEAIDFSGKAIWLHSSDGPEVTIIDATRRGASVVVCASSEGPDTVLEGFTITGGSATNGGGIYNYYASPTMTNCTFSGNTASYYGGGMYNEYYASPTVTNCTFSANTAMLLTIEKTM